MEARSALLQASEKNQRTDQLETKEALKSTPFNGSKIQRNSAGQTNQPFLKRSGYHVTPDKIPSVTTEEKVQSTQHKAEQVVQTLYDEGLTSHQPRVDIEMLDEKAALNEKNAARLAGKTKSGFFNRLFSKKEKPLKPLKLEAIIPATDLSTNTAATSSPTQKSGLFDCCSGWKSSPSKKQEQRAPLLSNSDEDSSENLQKNKIK
ncbi:MAG: hypothetical protein ACD_60C00015G0024 [uncultured bacterium]|nr:MAG: hypothetical protein ACD_60C00015G0024 [uncultured bacterium]